MRKNIENIVVIGASAIISLKLFIFGLSFPLNYRVRGDAYQYLAIADQFPNLYAILQYAGPRTVGIPFIDFTIGKLVLSLTGEDSLSLLSWVNAIGLVLLLIHLSSAWFFSKWFLKTGFIRSHYFALALFFLLATYPPLIGHTTTPLSDTLSVDLLLISVMTFHSALTTEKLLQSTLPAVVTTAMIGFSILVRPGNLMPFATALCVILIIATFRSARKAAVVGGIIVGSICVLLPFSQNCMQKYGVVCLQSPSTFNFIESTQSGLRGARISWQKMHLSPGHTPILPDNFMYSRFAQKCEVQHLLGTDRTSLTGCLLLQPAALPLFLVKKWMGLFDHYRFTPYLEENTPAWLIFVTRLYDALAWVGFSLFALFALQATISKQYRTSLKEKLGKHLSSLFLITYSIVLLAQHTVLHTEDRYGFPLIPLALVTLMIHLERLHLNSSAYQTWVPRGIYCLVTGIAFVMQIREWDQSTFF
jgi:hypothetical protein